MSAGYTRLEKQAALAISLETFEKDIRCPRKRIQDPTLIITHWRSDKTSFSRFTLHVFDVTASSLLFWFSWLPRTHLTVKEKWKKKSEIKCTMKFQMHWPYCRRCPISSLGDLAEFSLAFYLDLHKFFQSCRALTTDKTWFGWQSTARHGMCRHEHNIPQSLQLIQKLDCRIQCLDHNINVANSIFPTYSNNTAKALVFNRRKLLRIFCRQRPSFW